jgi:hypothetical protein
MHAAPQQCFHNALAYFATLVSYECKMFINLAPGGAICRKFDDLFMVHLPQKPGQLLLVAIVSANNITKPVCNFMIS